jgi:hypothetical protein
MRTIDLIESSFHRVVVVAVATSLVILALLGSKYYFRADETAIDSRIVQQSAPGPAAKTEEVSFVASPTIDTNPKFFFGAGDGSNGYYAERPRP